MSKPITTHIWKAFLFPVIAMAALTGCLLDGPDTRNGEGALGARDIRLSYTVDDMPLATRAVAALPHETGVKDIHVLFYEHSADGSNRLAAWQHATAIEGSHTFMLTVPAGVNPGTDYQTLIVANAHAFAPGGDAYNSDEQLEDRFDLFLEENKNKTYAEMRVFLYAETNKLHDLTDGSQTDYLPMGGRLVDNEGQDILFSYTDLGDGTLTGAAYAVQFSRLVSRLDLKNLVPDKLIIDKVKLCNYRESGFYFHKDALSGSIVSNVDGTDEENQARYVKMPDPQNDESSGASFQQMEGMMYAFPNIVPISVQNDEVTTCFMIAGYYQDGTDNTPAQPKQKLTYYRLNFANPGESQVLKGNYRYIGRINSVKGPGSDTEEGAATEEAPQLGYDVDDSWEEDDNTTVTDDKGNFLTISRNTLTFEGFQDLSQSVKVQVKEGLSWGLEWDNTYQGGNENSDKFKYARVDDGSFSVTTGTDNATDFTYNARLLVKATGNGMANPLTASILVTQLSSKDEMSILVVDGQTGTLTADVAGAGGTVRFQVKTGSAKAGWQCVDERNAASVAGVIWTHSGANGGTLQISLPTNISGAEREFRFTVNRTEAGVADPVMAPVTIVVKQPKSEYLLTVMPYVDANQNPDGFVVQGFSTEAANPNGIAVSEKFTVYLPETLQGTYEWEAVSDFRANVDLFLTKETAAPKTTQATWAADNNVTSTVTGTSGQSFYINVFRTGPGDPVIEGTLSITARPKDGQSGEMQTIQQKVTIKTDCVIDHVIIKSGSTYLLVADRNVGAQPRYSTDRTSVEFYPAGNFSNVANMEIWGKGAAENTYEQWRGLYFTFAKANEEDLLATEFFAVQNGGTQTNINENEKYYKSADIDKWVVPTKDQLTTISQAVLFSKSRPFLVSVEKIGTKAVGCFFPIAGFASGTTAPSGHYWSSTPFGDGGYRLYLTASSATVNGDSSILQYLVRPVRPLTSAEFNGE